MEGRLDKLGRRAQRRLEESRPRISPIVHVELDYLFEIGRTDRNGQQALMHLARTTGLRMDDAPFAHVAAASAEHTWTRDPFDRIIVAQAALASTPLLTGDRAMLEHYAHAIDVTR
jgi:PIN domain nuclease of toxin-antitoxin system